MDHEGSPPPLAGLLETALYVADLARSVAFYRALLGRAPMLDTPRLCAFPAGSSGVLLLFQKGATSDDLPTDGGTVPGHEGEGRLHMAFAIAAADLPLWRGRIASLGLPLESEVRWARGGTSLYVRDPDGHAIEFATPGLWPND